MSKKRLVYNKGGRAMETLAILEERINALIQNIKELKSENVALSEENKRLLHQIEAIENSLLRNDQSMEELNQEKKATQQVVDSLITSIEGLLSQKEQ